MFVFPAAFGGVLKPYLYHLPLLIQALID